MPGSVGCVVMGSVCVEICVERRGLVVSLVSVNDWDVEIGLAVGGAVFGRGHTETVAVTVKVIAMGQLNFRISPVAGITMSVELSVQVVATNLTAFSLSWW